MKMHAYPPGEHLRPFVKSYLIIESGDGMENNLLPDTSVIMTFRIRGKVTHRTEEEINLLPFSVITGLRRSPRQVRYAPGSATLIVKFSETGASAFLPLPVHKLFGKTVPLDNFITKEKIDQVENRLGEAENHLQQIAVTERFLLSLFHPPDHDVVIARAIEKIEFSKGLLPIGDVLEGLPLSRDPFEKRFRRVTGSSPKQFSSIVRMRNILSGPQKGNLTSIAYTSGYFDQAHFIKDFRRFTGTTPTIFFRSGPYW
ncbi:helix-turn-helix domain-containing protein [Sinomicrobium sp. M5D2P17]